MNPHLFPYALLILKALLIGFTYCVLVKGLGKFFTPFLKKIYLVISFSALSLHILSIAALLTLGYTTALRNNIQEYTQFPSLLWHYGLVFIILFAPIWIGYVKIFKRFQSPTLKDSDNRLSQSRRDFLLHTPGFLSFMPVTASPLIVSNSSQIAIRSVELFYPDLPSSLDGFKIGHISDIHLGPFIDIPFLEFALSSFNAQNLDLFVMTGDVSSNTDYFAPAAAAMNGMVVSTGGQFACIGNHDHMAGAKSFCQTFGKFKTQALVDERALIRHKGSTIEVAGLDFPEFDLVKAKSDLEKLEKIKKITLPVNPDFKICLSHHPRSFVTTSKLGYDLTLSGHTHGGQMRLFGKSVAQPLFPYLDGIYTHGKQYLFVTSGLGHWAPFRINCPCEIVIITLRKGLSLSHWKLKILGHVSRGKLRA